MKCSRCRIIREVGITDKEESDLHLYKTCSSCRDKLKVYRRTHEHKKLKLNEDRRYVDDDNNEVDIAVKQVKRTKNTSILKRIIDFNNILSKVYQMAYKTDIFLDEVCKIDDFTLPHLTITENRRLGGEDVPVNLLMKQTERDEKLKSELVRCLEVHYVSRIQSVLSCSNVEFRFYSSSWKSGKYYAQYRCIDDKTALKRFGIDSDVEIEEDDCVEERQSSFKSKVLDWIEPKNVESVNLQLDVDNEPVNVHFQQILGYYCESKLNFIADYAKCELRVKLVHKLHRPELKLQSKMPDDNVKSVPMKYKNKALENEKNSVEKIGLSDKLESLHKGLAN